MPQLSLYLDAPTMNALRDMSAHNDQSLSKFVANLIRDKVSDKHWPDGYWSIYGALKDDCIVEVDELDDSLDDDIPALDF